MTARARRRIALALAGSLLAASVFGLLALPSAMTPVLAQDPTAAPQDDPAAPPDDWALGACTAISRLEDATALLAGLGQAALAGDEASMVSYALGASDLGATALEALFAVESTYPQGEAVLGFLVGTAYGLVDLGTALTEGDPADAATVRMALGSVVQTYDGWLATEDELAALTATVPLDCSIVPVPSAAPLPSIQPAESVAPLPTFVGDVELEALFPTELAGQETIVDSITGPELLAQADPTDTVNQASLDGLEALLTEHGRSWEDLSVAFALIAPESGDYGSVTAFRVRGVDAATLVDGLIPLVTTDYLDLQQERTTIAGRDLVLISDGPYDPDGMFEYLYPKDDVIWSVSAEEPLLSEILGKLP